MANLKFYKMAQAPVGTTEKPLEKGAVWFDSTNHVIKIYDGANWTAYSGVIDASIVSEVLTIKKYDGSTVSVDFSVYATDEALSLLDERVGTLEGTVKGHGESITNLSGRMTTVEGKAKANEDKLAGLTETTVMAEIAKQVKVEADRATEAEGKLAERVVTLETASEDYKERIGVLEGKFEGDDSVAKQIENAVTAAETRVDEKLATKADKKTYEDYVAANDERVAAAEKAIADETDRAKAFEALLDEKIGVPADVEGVSAYSKDYTVGMDVKAAKDAAAEAQRTIDEFLTGEGIAPETLNSLKEITDYIETHGGEYTALVEDLGELSDAVDALEEKVDVEKVSTAINTAAGNAETAAKDYADGLIAGEVERAEAAYEKIGVAAGLVKALEEGAVATNATAISGLKEQVGTGTVDSRIATAKSEAITAAGEAADQKIADLKLAETYEKVGVAKGLVDALAESAVAGNTAAIAALDAKVTEGLSWVVFEE